MKWVVITILLLVIGGGWNLLSSSKSLEVAQPETNQDKEQIDRMVKSVESTSSSIFIPYWNIPSPSDDLSEYDTLIYFGVAPDSQGALIQDSGFKNIESFIANTSGTRETSSLLTIRMLDDEVSLAILEDVSLQSSVIRESMSIAQEYGFDGIVLDLELSVIPFDHVETSITDFVEQFAQEAGNENLTFGMTMYGDVFYRARPYNVAALSDHIDHIYIMAYDFHKSRGEPGPNFPFGHFQQMIADFTPHIDPEHITVVFGMYGYDWTLGKQGLPLKPAVAVPLNEIDQDGAIVDSLSREKHITFTDEEGYDHELWYEDEESAEVKIEYLKDQGVGSVGYWVWGYY